MGYFMPPDWPNRPDTRMDRVMDWLPGALMILAMIGTAIGLVAFVIGAGLHSWPLLLAGLGIEFGAFLLAVAVNALD